MYLYSQLIYYNLFFIFSQYTDVLLQPRLYNHNYIAYVFNASVARCVVGRLASTLLFSDNLQDVAQCRHKVL